MQKRLLVLFFAISLGLFGQSETGRAALEGMVSDPSGKSVASVEITIRETQTGFQRPAKTNVAGAFRAGALPVGVYTLEATSPGFGTSRITNIALTVGETKTVNLTLQVANV